MKMRSIVIIFLAVGLLLVGCSQLKLPDASPVDPLAMTPEEVVESFYNWYLEYPGNPTVDGAFKESPFLAETKIKSVEEELQLRMDGGADPFMCAQDLPEKIYAQPAEIEAAQARVRVNSTFVGHTFLVELEVQDGEWKIVHILCGR
jgi:hypothetical protein